MTHYTGDPRWLTVKYEGQCRRCGATIRRGSQAFYYPRGKAIYCEAEGCGGKESRSFEAAAWDGEFGCR